MFVDFSVENFGPFRERATLSLLAAGADGTTDNLLGCEAVDGGILSSAFIFGPNSSGKSYMVRAISALQSMVSAPMPADYTYPWYLPFRLSDETSGSPVSLGVRITIGGVLYCYSITFDSHEVVGEYLYSYPGGHKNVVFSRKGSEFKFGRSSAKGQKSISSMTAPSSSYLAVAAQFNNSVCLAVHKEIMGSICVLPDDRCSLMDRSLSLISSNKHIKDIVMRALNYADFGITDIRTDTAHSNSRLVQLSNSPPPPIGFLA